MWDGESQEEKGPTLPAGPAWLGFAVLTTQGPSLQTRRGGEGWGLRAEFMRGRVTSWTWRTGLHFVLEASGHLRGISRCAAARPGGTLKVWRSPMKFRAGVGAFSAKRGSRLRFLALAVTVQAASVRPGGFSIAPTGLGSRFKGNLEGEEAFCCPLPAGEGVEGANLICCPPKRLPLGRLEKEPGLRNGLEESRGTCPRLCALSRTEDTRCPSFAAFPPFGGDLRGRGEGKMPSLELGSASSHFCNSRK